MQGIGGAAKEAARTLALATSDEKNRALLAAASALRASSARILAANDADVLESGAGLSAAMLDRLRLDESRVSRMARGLEEIAAARDPIGTVSSAMAAAERLEYSAGLRAPRRHRHHLRKPSECHRRCRRAVLEVRQRGDFARRFGKLAFQRRDSCLPRARLERPRPCRPPASSWCRSADREAVGHMLAGLTESIDVIVPRGGKSLIARVQQEARVPVIGHLEGVCHVYVHARCRSRHGRDDRAERKNAPHRRVRCRRRHCWSTGLARRRTLSR